MGTTVRTLGLDAVAPQAVYASSLPSGDTRHHGLFRFGVFTSVGAPPWTGIRHMTSLIVRSYTTHLPSGEHEGKPANASFVNCAGLEPSSSILHTFMFPFRKDENTT